MNHIRRWLQHLKRPPRAKRYKKRIRRMRLPKTVAKRAYKHAPNIEKRQTHFAHEVVDIPPYEDRALRGERAPHRFCWRGTWYRVIDVASSWQDGRKKTAQIPDAGRLYVNVSTLPVGFFQLYFEHSNKRKDRGRWMLYRKIKIQNA